MDTKPQPRHPGGRPRLEATDRAILRAVGELIAEQGLRGTTINAVAARSGVARGTVYRRFPNRDAMLNAAMREWRGRDPEPLGDDIEANLRMNVEEARAVLGEPSFQAMLPALAEIQLGAESDEGVRSIIFPQRDAMAGMYRKLASAGGFRTDIEPDLPNDIAVGALLYHLLYSGRVPDAARAQAIVDVVLDGVRVREGAL
ncbi:MAG TPA: TetR/AcrR family transcriptional regulator [Candidatus Limnocylindrales bacterium]|jgi:AcrR family transcriptional regulator